MKPETSVKLDIVGEPHLWKIRVTRELTEKQQDCLRLALYWYEDLTVEQKESLIDGTELTWFAYGYEIFALRARSQNAELPVTFVRLPDADAATAIALREANHGIH